MPLGVGSLASDSCDSQSIIVGCYVIIFGAGRHIKNIYARTSAKSIASDSTPRVPDPSIHFQMGSLPVQLSR